MYVSMINENNRSTFIVYCKWTLPCDQELNRDTELMSYR